MRIDFTKLHGLGNDFILIENADELTIDLEDLALNMCDRHTGIGADGLLLLLKSDSADFKMRIINSDGSEPEMCGNGIRCFAKYLYDIMEINQIEYKIETLAGTIIPRLTIEDNKVKYITVNMGEPVFKSPLLPIFVNSKDAINYKLIIDGKQISLSTLLMGVPHTMMIIDDFDEIDIPDLGRKIEKNKIFPQGTNVNFVKPINSSEIAIRTWERGAGQTLACGTGSCAAVVSSIFQGTTDNRVIVHLQLGDLVIELKDNQVFMSGPAEIVFSGIYHYQT